MLKDFFFSLVAFVLNFSLPALLCYSVSSQSSHIFGRITMGTGGVLSNGRIISDNSVFLLAT